MLSRHRADVRGVAEFGTGGGVTSVYLGVAAALAGGGSLDTFDVVDARSPDVMRAWLPSMRFHRVDLSGGVSSPAVDAALANASIVLVDHVDRLEFCRDVVAPRLKRRGMLLVHDFTNSVGPDPTEHSEWQAALGPLGFARFYRDYGDLFASSLAVFARPADFDDFRGREGVTPIDAGVPHNDELPG